MLEDLVRSRLSGLTGTLCAAVSGGEDSMALLHLLLRLREEGGFSLVCLHVEHGIRGASSLRDADFVRDFCRKAGVPFRLERVDAPALAAAEGLSLEDAARRLRYACFARLVGEGFCDRVLTAHHRDDRAESLLLHLLRGSGLPGLVGMRRERGFLLRPLLDLSKAEISAYVRQHGIPFVLDESNLDPAFSRNFLRLEILPPLEARFPGCSGRLAELGDRVGETLDFLDGQAAAFVRGGEDFSEVDLSLPPPLLPFALRLAAARLGVTSDLEQRHLKAAEQLALSGRNGAALCLPRGLIVRREYDRLRLDFGTPSPPGELPFGIGSFPYGGQRIEVCPVPAREGKGLFADAAAIPPGAVFRPPQPGDRFRRFGGLSKNLGDFLTDRRIPLRVRPLLPVLALGSRVLCVLPLEIAEELRITPQTGQILRLTLTPAGPAPEKNPATPSKTGGMDL